ncbi:hypothetical protein RYX36_006461 [Vicia faba]
MSRPPIAISYLKSENNVWKLSICVVDLWIVKELNGQQHLEAIIQDANTIARTQVAGAGKKAYVNLTLADE